MDADSPDVRFTLATRDGYRSYKSWFRANLAGIEGIIAAIVPRLTKLEESEFGEFTANCAKLRFDEILEPEFQDWTERAGSVEELAKILAKAGKKLVREFKSAWGVGSNGLVTWCNANLVRCVDNSMIRKTIRWQHRAKSVQIVRSFPSDADEQLVRLIAQLEQLSAEEKAELVQPNDSRSIKVWAATDYRHMYGGYSGDFLERVRQTIESVGLLLRPPSGMLGLDYCLLMLVTELVCERAPLHDSKLARLNSEQISRYCFAVESYPLKLEVCGHIYRVCEALTWYCRRLLSVRAAAKNTTGKVNGLRRRGPDVEISRQRIELVTKLSSELATLKQKLRHRCTVGSLKEDFPDYHLWTILTGSELTELVKGVAFTPKAYAENLVRKFGLTSRETLKKDRRKLRQAQQG